VVIDCRRPLAEDRIGESVTFAIATGVRLSRLVQSPTA